MASAATHRSSRAPRGEAAWGQEEEARLASSIQEILEERARLLAEPPPAEVAGATQPVLCFRLGEEVHAVALHLLRSVERAQFISPVPCTPPFVAGAMNVRGEILTVIDLARLLGLERTAGVRQHVLVVEVAAADLPAGVLRTSVLVDELVEVLDVDLEQLDHSLSGREYVQGVAQGKVVVLDFERLLLDKRLEVDEEVE